jgi:hypothetical protein
MMPRLNRRLFLIGCAGLALPAQAATRVRLFELYDADLAFSGLARQLEGQRIAIQGFMAPHLKAESDFFILSNTPVETCPFCATEGEWIDSIVFVRLRHNAGGIRPGTVIVTEGTLELGPQADAVTGFVSKVRLVDSVITKTQG